MSFFNDIKSRFLKPKETDGVSSNEEVSGEPKAQVKAVLKFKMGDVFNESVKEYAMGAFAKNEPFIADYYKQKAYGGLLLEVGEIGILDKKNKTDEAIGNFIEVVRGGSIKTYTTPELFLHEEIILIPDKDSLVRMQEYSFLRKAEFPLVFIQDNQLLDTEKKIMLKDVKSIFDNNSNVSAFLGIENLSELEEAEKAKEKETQGEEAKIEIKDVDEEVQENRDLIAENLDDNEWVEDDEDLPFADKDDEKQEVNKTEEPEKPKEQKQEKSTANLLNDVEHNLREKFGDELVDKAFRELDSTKGELTPEVLEKTLEKLYNDHIKSTQVTKEPAEGEEKEAKVTDETKALDNKDDKNDDEEDDDNDDEEEDDDDDDFEIDVEVEDAANVLENVKKVFHSDNISLEISDYQFITEILSVYKPLTLQTDREKGLLNDELNERCKLINSEMKELFISHIKRLHEKYNTLLDQVFEDITGQIDYTVDSNPWHEKYKELIEKKEMDMAQMPEQTAVAFERYETDYASKKEEYAKSAYDRAILEYDKEHGFTREVIQGKIDQEYTSRIDAKYNEQFAKLHNERKAIAQQKIDIAIKSIIENEIKPVFEQFKEEDLKLFNERKKELESFLNEHREQEMARIQIAKREMDEESKADKVRKEFITRINHMKDDFARQISELEQSYNNLKTSKEFLDQAKDRDFAAQVAISIGDLEKANMRIEDLNKQVLEEKRQSTRQVQEAIDKYEKYLREMELNYEREKAKNKATRTAIMVVIVLFMFIMLVAAGYVLLYSFRSDNSAPFNDSVAFMMNTLQYHTMLC